MPKLTTARIAALTARAKPYDTPDGEIAGLIVRTHPTGKKTFLYRYRRRTDRKKQSIWLGQTQVGLAAARKTALGLAAEVAAGGDPAARLHGQRAEVEAQRRQAEASARGAATRRLGTYLGEVYARHAETEQKRGAETVARVRAAFASFMDLDIGEIDQARVRDWRSARLKAGIATTTIDREVGMLSTLLGHAVRVSKVLPVNPLVGLKPLVSAAARTNSVRFLDDHEEVKLREALRQRDAEMRAKRTGMNRWLAARSKPELAAYSEHFTDHLEPVVLTLLNTGLRFGELAQLRWASIDFRTKLITVVGEHAKSGKTRHVPMPAEVVSVLSRWRANSQDLVFPGERGPLVDIKTSWARLLKRAGIERFRIHDLRHSYASRLVQRGVSLFTVQQLLGHSSPIMTMRYSHLTPHHLADAVAVLDQPYRSVRVG